MQLHIVTNLVENEKMRVFIVHGIAEHQGRYDHVAKQLNAAGYSVIRFDLRGHGLSEGKRGYVKHFEDYLEDIDYVFNLHKGTKNVLLGHSMGALITHLYMIKPNHFDLSITSAGPTYYIKDANFLRYIGYKWLGFLSIKNNLSSGKLSHIEQVEKDYMADPLVLKQYKIRLIGELFIRGVKHLNAHVNDHYKPILMTHGEEDTIVPVGFSKRLFELLPQSDKQLILYPHDRHETMNEKDQKTVIKDIITWLDKH